MLFVFGIRSYRILGRRLSELDLPEPDGSPELEARQYYFHLFYLPIFPVGKKWVFTKDGKRYDVDDKIRFHIAQQNIKLGKTIFAFSGLLLTALILLLVGGGIFLRNIAEDKQRIEDHLDEIAAFKEHINHPDNDDYYFFEIRQKEERSYTHYTVFRVTDSDSETITFQTPDPDPLLDMEYGIQFGYPGGLFLPESEAYGNGILITVDKELLLDTVDFGPDVYPKNKGVAILPDVPSSLFLLNDIRSYPDYAPILEYSSSGSTSNNDKSLAEMSLRNVGYQTIVTDIFVREGEYGFIFPELPFILENDERIYFKAEYESNDFNAVLDLVCVDGNGNTFLYRVTWTFVWSKSGFEVTIETL